ncbi:tannase/feruloyl esterase family alpha/beta hydrolase [Actinoplanes awajinensis]|uniref:Feruloyl esterase n=1 Tax=Actinoplanes awajinensis subsp. mycoplanecinus TaxID=135947 RepID=A0A0X3URZ9_9ACTN|nr:tannase/feruloyl esterase family alpha/beta hydrolase [Actinoplanes awajinensis]KUL35265.1 hypothetical protein ADL15_14690 [Actinoplanes awajinensis subsp. mycoplanecinus]
MSFVKTITAVLLLVAATLLMPGDARATAAPGGLANLEAVLPVMSCADLTTVELSGVTITSAVVTSANAPAPYCAVTGTIAPANTVVMRLPTQGWTQRYLQTGCGGLCGSATINYTQAAGCRPVADATIASATTDMGHQGKNDGSWAAGNIVVQNTFHHAWNVLANKDANGQYILLADKLPLIHAAVIRACDRLDGVADGILDDPRDCRFDPGTLVCPDTATCLTRAQAAVVRKLHDGATDADGRRLEQEISHEWGSELDWTLFVPAKQGDVTFSENIALSFLRYLAYRNVADPDYQLTDLKFTLASFRETVRTSDYLSATDPDLSRFRRGGGKLVLWHGWSDQHISPQATLNYYDTMRRTMGGRTVDAFARLYLFPGMAHCGGGLGPNTFDVLTPVMAWVETGTRPGSIVATPATTSRAVAPFVERGAPAAGYDWAGAALYTHGYQKTCRVVNGKLVCS